MPARSPKRSARTPKSTVDPKPPEAAARRTVPRTGVALVVAIAILVGIAGVLNAFTQDDLSILVGSTRLHGFEELRDILTLPYWPPPAAPDLYRPVASLLLAAQYAIGDGAPVVFRITSYALY